MLNATFGNAAELIIALMALSKGLIGVVKASITGSVGKSHEWSSVTEQKLSLAIAVVLFVTSFAIPGKTVDKYDGGVIETCRRRIESLKINILHRAGSGLD